VSVIEAPTCRRKHRRDAPIRHEGRPSPSKDGLQEATGSCRFSRRSGETWQRPRGAALIAGGLYSNSRCGN